MIMHFRTKRLLQGSMRFRSVTQIQYNVDHEECDSSETTDERELDHILVVSPIKNVHFEINGVRRSIEFAGRSYTCHKRTLSIEIVLQQRQSDECMRVHHARARILARGNSRPRAPRIHHVRRDVLTCGA